MGHKIDKKLLKIVGNFGFLSDSDDDDMVVTVKSDAKKNASKSLAERVKILQDSSDDSSDEQPLISNLTKKPKPTIQPPKPSVQPSISTFFQKKTIPDKKPLEEWASNGGSKAASKKRPQFDSSDDEAIGRPKKRRKLNIAEDSSDFLLEPP